MTTDEVQKPSDHRRPPATDDDEFSSEDYIAITSDDDSETVILGTVPGETTRRQDVAEVTHEPDLDPVVNDLAEGYDEAVDPAADEAATSPGDRSEPETDGGPGTEAEEHSNQEHGNQEHGNQEHGNDVTDAEPSVAEAVAPDDNAFLEMRQVAGLTAGSMMKLNIGRAFEFSESNEGGTFSLRVLENGEVVVHPGSARAVIDEIEVQQPMLMGDALLNVSSACFSVRRPRPPASSESRMEAVEAAFASVSAIHVPPMGPEEPLAPEQLAGSRLGTIINNNPLTQGSVGPEALSFLQSIRRARSVVAERHRLMHPDPEELKTRLSRLDPGLWERSRNHPLFGRFGVGYANIPWEPKFDNPELIPDMLHEPIVSMGLLPWVPVTANLLYGPLGIVGKRAARMAACRHAILSLAALSMPGEVRFAIRSGKNTAASWYWTRALPPIMSAETESPYVVTVVDGVEGADLDNAVRQAAYGTAVDDLSDDKPMLSLVEAGPDDDVDDDLANTAEIPVTESDVDDLDALDAVEAIAPGYIVLAESLDELTQPCGSVLQIEADGTGMVTNHLNETIQVTPIGVTEAFAHDMATRIADILTDSFL